jgi:uncharacterized protein
MTSAYLDTSALAKWCLREPGSDAFEAFVVDLPTALVSRLTRVEMRCLLARRRRSGTIGPGTERSAAPLFENDIRSGHLVVLDVGEACWAEAVALVDRLSEVGLRTLDALHLAIAHDARADMFATADRALAKAAARLGFEARIFG